MNHAYGMAHAEWIGKDIHAESMSAFFFETVSSPSSSLLRDVRSGSEITCNAEQSLLISDCNDKRNII